MKTFGKTTYLNRPLKTLARCRYLCYYFVMLTKQKKARVMKEVQKHESDTGSAEVQVGLLSKKIDALTSHLKKNNKDKHSRRGLLGMVESRRRHLNYLKHKDPKRYAETMKNVKG